MQLEPVLICFFLFVLFPFVLFKGIASVKQAKVAAGERGGDLRASELRRMIADAVETATAALAARITDLEERLGDEPVAAIRERVGARPDAPAAPARVDAPALTAAFDPEADLDDADGRPVQRRARA